jgi:hypothetical protein
MIVTICITVLKKAQCTEWIEVANDGEQALNFLEEYEKLDNEVRALKMNIIAGFRRKYLNEEMVKEIISTYFPENVRV